MNKKEKNNKTRIDNNIMCYSTYFIKKITNTHSRLKVTQSPFLHKTKIGFFN